MTVDDAVFACHLYEEAVTSRSGYSYLGKVPSASIGGGHYEHGAGQGE